MLYGRCTKVFFLDIHKDQVVGATDSNLWTMEVMAVEKVLKIYNKFIDYVHEN